MLQSRAAERRLENLEMCRQVKPHTAQKRVRSSRLGPASRLLRYQLGRRLTMAGRPTLHAVVQVMISVTVSRALSAS